MMVNPDIIHLCTSWLIVLNGESIKLPEEVHHIIMTGGGHSCYLSISGEAGDMVHQHRDDLAGEHRLGDLGQLILYCLFMALWLSDIFLKYSNFLNAHIPSAVRLPIGVLLLIIAATMAGSGLVTIFNKKAQTQVVIKKGVFHIVRHPIYLGEIIMYSGLLMLNISLAAASVLIVAILFLHYISRYEEKLLIARFGDEYRQYMKEVPMWFPRP